MRGLIYACSSVADTLVPSRRAQLIGDEIIGSLAVWCVSLIQRKNEVCSEIETKRRFIDP